MRLHPLTVLLCGMVAFALMTAGCETNPSRPIDVAKTIPQKGYAAAGLYQIAQSRALDLMQNAATPASVKTAIADTDKAATPVVRKLLAALKVYTAISADLAASPDKLATAIADVDKWTKEAKPLIDALMAALGKAPAPVTLAPQIPREPALAWSNS